MAEEPGHLERERLEIEKRRSKVRRLVTYGAIYGYLFLAAVVVIWLMWAGKYEVAIGVLGGVAGLAGSISGFWFGSRRSPGGEVPPAQPAGGSGDTQTNNPPRN